MAKTYFYLANKWKKGQVLANNPKLRPYIPETKLFNETNLNDLTEKYPIIFGKPIVGTGGSGIIKISKESEQFIIKTNVITKVATNKSELFKMLNTLMGERPYMIQQGIPLISIQNRPLDFRVLLLRPKNKWELMGIMGKWAAKGKIVTNHSRGGAAITLDKALRYSVNATDQQIKLMEQKLIQLGFEAAKTLNKSYHGVRELGMDVAIDDQLNTWILETNSRPNYHLFKSHKDKRLFGKIDLYMNYIRRK